METILESDAGKMDDIYSVVFIEILGLTYKEIGWR